MKINIEKIFVSYIVLGAIVCNILPIPELVKGFLSMFSFLIVPYLVGNMFFQMKFFRNRMIKLDIIGRYFLSWSAGVVIIVLLMTSLYALNLFNILIFTYALLGFFIIFYFFYWKFYRESRYHVPTINKTSALLLFASVTVTCLFILYFNPFPLWREWDFYFTHNPLSWYIIDYGQIFRTFAYIDSLSILIAIGSYLFNVDTHTFGWMCAHFLFPISFAFGLYYFLRSFKIVKNEKLLILIVWSSLFVFAAKETGTPFISAPKTIIFLLIPFIFGFLNNHVLSFMNRKDIEKELIISFPILIFIILLTFLGMRFLLAVGSIHYFYISLFVLLEIYLFLFLSKNKRYLLNYYLFLLIIINISFFNHIFMGMVISFVSLAYIFFTYLFDKYPTKTKIFVIISTILCVLFILFQSYGLINIGHEWLIDSSSNINVMFKQSFNDRLNMIENMYPSTVFWLFFFMGIIYGLVTYIKKFAPLFIVFLCSVMGFLFVLDIGIYRFIVLLYVLSAFFILYGIRMCYFIVIRNNKNDKIEHLKKFVFFFFLTFIVLIPSIETPISEIKLWVKDGGNYSTIYIEEYNAGIWMKSHLSKDTIMISDPRTSYHISSFSHIRRLPDVETPLMEEHIYNLLNYNDSREIYGAIRKLTRNETLTKFHGPCVAKLPGICKKDFSPDWVSREPPINSSVIVISGRTIVWENKKKPGEFLIVTGFYDIKQVQGHENFLNKFSDKIYFTQLYNNSKIYIFGVNPEPGVPFKLQNTPK